jgi:CheY-like chemotaxis protein
VAGDPKDDPKTDLVGALHEVSNALTVLLGWVAEARDPSATPEEIAHALRILEQRARSARDLARRAIGVKVPPPGDVDLPQVVADVVESLRVEAARASVTITPSGPSPSEARIPLGDDLAQIITNLALNALHYAPAGSEVRIVTAVEPATVTIDVEDDGPGVSEERSFSVFEGDTTRQGGAGIGLRHARAMARAAGGDLTLLPGAGGARFRIRWPRADAPPIKAPDPSGRLSRPRLQVLAGTKVLIVEDDADVTELLGTALEARGAEVTVARTADELRGRIDEGLHAVLVDLSPIAEDVQGALAMVKARAAKAEIVFITGSAEALPEGMESSAWVRKPFEVGEVVDAILACKRPA